MFCTPRIQVNELAQCSLIGAQELLGGDRGKTKQRETLSLKLAKKKLSCQMQGSCKKTTTRTHHEHLPWLPWKTPSYYGAYMLALESKVSRQWVGSCRLPLGFPRVSNAEPSRGASSCGVNGTLVLSNPSRSQKPTRQNQRLILVWSVQKGH